MRRKIAAFLAVILVLLTFNVSVTPAQEPETTKGIVIIHTNDVHCSVDQDSPKGTFAVAQLAAYRAKLEEAGYTTILVDGGDFIQGDVLGTLSDGKYLARIMDKLGYDVAVPGNHEFDYGMESFLQIAQNSGAKYISANFTDLKTDQPVFDQYTIVEKEGFKIGFVGCTTPYTLSSSSPSSFQDENGNWIYGFCQDDTGAKFYESVQNAVNAARAAGADIIVAIGHCGVNEGSEYDRYSSESVVAGTTGIDVFIDGHSHTVINKTVKNKDGEDVILQQTGTKLANIGTVTIDTANSNSISAALVGYNDYTVTGDTESAEYQAYVDVNSFVQEIEAENAEKLGEVVAESQVDLYINDPETGKRIIRNRETNIGDLVSDAYRWYTGADVAISNGGGMRADIRKGSVTFGDIISVLPFNNSLAVAQVTGQQIIDILEFGARYNPEENGGFMHTSGVTYEIHRYIDSSVKINSEGQFVSVDGEYRVKNVKINGEDIVPDRIYTLAGYDYHLVSGGDGISGIIDKSQVTMEQIILDNQCLIKYIEEKLGGVIGQEYANPYGSGRIAIYDEKPQEGAPETGDSSMLWLYVALLAAGGAGCVKFRKQAE